MKRIAFGVVAALALGQAALAADLPVRALTSAPAPVAPSWTGFYLGVHAGWGWTSQDNATSALNTGAGAAATSPVSFNLDNDSPIAGLQIGYNYQFSSWVVGIEGDISGSRLTDSQTAQPLTGAIAAGSCGVVGLPCGTATMSQDIRWLSTVRGRLGYAWGPGVLYVTAGAAWADVNYSATVAWPVPAPEVLFTAGFTSIRSGPVVGGGYEWMLTNNWTLRGEFLHYWFNQAPITQVTNVGLTNTFTWSRFDINVARVGLNYKFN